jgi:hypothetical protein
VHVTAGRLNRDPGRRDAGTLERATDAGHDTRSDG